MVGLIASEVGLGFSLTGTEVAVSDAAVFSTIVGGGLSVGTVVGSGVLPHATSSKMDVRIKTNFMNGRLMDNAILFESECFA